MGEYAEYQLAYEMRRGWRGPIKSRQPGRNAIAAYCPHCGKGIRPIAGRIEESMAAHIRAKRCDTSEARCTTHSSRGSKMTPEDVKRQDISEMAHYYKTWAKDIRSLNGQSVDADYADKTASTLLELRDARDKDQKDLAAAQAGFRAACVANEQSRSALGPAVTELEMITMRREWMAEGRGPYEWDDPEYQKEFGVAMQEWQEAIKPLQAVAANWSYCPTDPDEIAVAREIFEDRLAIKKLSSKGEQS